MATDTKQLTTDKPKPADGKRTTAAAADMDILERALPGFREAKEKLADLVEQFDECQREIARLQDAAYLAPHVKTEDDVDARVRALVDGGTDPGPTTPIAEQLPLLANRSLVLSAAVRAQRGIVETMHAQASAIVWQQQGPAYQKLAEAQILALVGYATHAHERGKFLAGMQRQGVTGAPAQVIGLPWFGDPADPRSLLASLCDEAVTAGITSWAKLIGAGLPNRVAIERQQWADGKRAQEEAHEQEMARLRRDAEEREAKARKEAEQHAAGERGFLSRVLGL